MRAEYQRCTMASPASPIATPTARPASSQICRRSPAGMAVSMISRKISGGSRAMSASTTIEPRKPKMAQRNGRANAQALRITRPSMLASFTASLSRGSMVWGPIRICSRRLRPAPNLPTGARPTMRSAPAGQGERGPGGRSIGAVRRAVACVVAARRRARRLQRQAPELTVRRPPVSGVPSSTIGRAVEHRRTDHAGSDDDAGRRPRAGGELAGLWRGPRVRDDEGPARPRRRLEGHDRPLRRAAARRSSRTSASGRCSSTRAVLAWPARSWWSRPASTSPRRCATGSTSSRGIRGARARSIPLDCVDDLDPFLIGADPTPDSPEDQQQAAALATAFVTGCQTRSGPTLPYAIDPGHRPRHGHPAPGAG